MLPRLLRPRGHESVTHTERSQREVATVVGLNPLNETVSDPRVHNTSAEAAAFGGYTAGYMSIGAASLGADCSP